MSEHRHAPHTSKADAVLANLDDLVRSGRNGRGGEPLHDDLKAVLALVASVVRTEYAMTDEPGVRAALEAALREMAFMQSVIASGERLSAGDIENIAEVREQARAALAATPTPDDRDREVERLLDALLDIERWSKGLGPTMDNNDEDAGRGNLGRIHRRAREVIDAGLRASGGTEK